LKEVLRLIILLFTDTLGLPVFVGTHSNSPAKSPEQRYFKKRQPQSENDLFCLTFVKEHKRGDFLMPQRHEGTKSG
jgi:hypothetical protein